MAWPKGKPVPPELREKRRQQMLGNKINCGREQAEQEKEKRRLGMLGNQNALGSKRTEKQKNESSKRLMGNKHLLGHVHSIESRRKMSISKMGNKNLLGHKHSEETLRRMSDVKKGESNAAYIDGRSRERQQGRHAESQTVEYRLWRLHVFERDDYTCQMCGDRGGILVADHIKSWRYFVALRYELSNGRTLCQPCHRQTENYGSKAHKCTQ